MGRAAEGRFTGLRLGVEDRARSTTGWARTGPRRDGAPISKPGSRRRAPRSRCRRRVPRATSGWPRTWGRSPSRSACDRASSTGGRSATRSRRRCASTRRSSAEPADRALGRWYFKVPGLFGGSNQKSEEHLRKALTYDPDSTISWYFLAETLFDLGRHAEARDALQKVIDVPIKEEWAPEDREWKDKARALLGKARKQ